VAEALITAEQLMGALPLGQKTPTDTGRNDKGPGDKRMRKP
jgi:hypothetical protein